MELKEIIFACAGLLIGGSATFLFLEGKISSLKNRMLDKDLVISLLKTNTKKSKKNAYKAPTKVKAKVQ
jgi:hypothetical protein|tara:strand:+ start:5892 stop:6098 length:207 start_codon:yes stop_codon:yes gene_type:complete